jgi:hypothetical protein
MGIRTRLALVAVVAAAVVFGLVPHGVATVTGTATTQIMQAVETPFDGPISCADATCGKAAPTPTAPSPGVALAVVLGALVVAGVAASAIRRRGRQVMALPAGNRDPLFHPPQFS